MQRPHLTESTLLTLLTVSLTLNNLSYGQELKLSRIINESHFLFTICKRTAFSEKYEELKSRYNFVEEALEKRKQHSTTNDNESSTAVLTTMGEGNIFWCFQLGRFCAHRPKIQMVVLVCRVLSYPKCANSSYIDIGKFIHGLNYGQKNGMSEVWSVKCFLQAERFNRTAPGNHEIFRFR